MRSVKLDVRLDITDTDITINLHSVYAKLPKHLLHQLAAVISNCVAEYRPEFLSTTPAEPTCDAVHLRL